MGSIPTWGRSPGGGNGNSFKYSCLETPMDRGAWWAIVHGVPKSWAHLSMQAYTHARADTVPKLPLGLDAVSFSPA